MIALRHCWKVAPALALLGGLSVAPTQAHAADDSIELSAKASPSPVHSGEHLVLDLDVKIPPGYHFYSMTKVPGGPLVTKIQVKGEGLEQVGVWHAPEPHVEVDPNFKLKVEYYDTLVKHQATFKVNAKPDTVIPANIVVRGQICNDKRCIPLKAKTKLDIPVSAGQARAEFAKPAALSGVAFTADRKGPEQDGAAAEGGDYDEGEEKGLGDEGLFEFIAMAMLAGFAALVTPCVFPMIPITVSFFSKFSKVSMQRSITMGSIYAVSIVGTFTLLGVLITLIFGAVGMQALSTSPIFNLFMAALLIVFAYNLFGAFEITIPNWLTSRTAEKEHELKNQDGDLGAQALGVFFMGLTFTLVSFTCTVGFIGMVLAAAAKGDVFYPAIGMFAFSLSFSLPFFFLAVFPSWADKLKGKAGDWMIAVKVTLGFVELAGAFKFLSNVDLLWKMETITRPLVLACWTGLFIFAALYLLRLIVLPHDNPEERQIGSARMTFALLLFSVGIFSSTGISHTRSMGGWLDGWLPPAVYPGQEGAHGGGEGGSGGSGGHLPFMKDDIPGAMAKARELNVPVFIDFTGYTCTNCRFMEASVFPRPEIRSRLEKMVLVSAYTDCEEKVCETQRDMQIERFNTAALPYYVVLDPFKDKVLGKFADMTKEPKKYQDFLQKALDRFDKVKPKNAPTKEAPKADEGHAKAEKGGHGGGVEGSIEIATTGKKVDFTFPGLKTGRDFSLSKLRGKWVFLNFWASWCGPCKEEIEHEFPDALAANPHVKYVTVAFDGEETRDEAMRFAKQAGLLNHITLLGGDDIEEAGLSEEFNVSPSLPISYVIHPDGHIAWIRNGAVNKATLMAVLEQTK